MLAGYPAPVPAPPSLAAPDRTRRAGASEAAGVRPARFPVLTAALLTLVGCLVGGTLVGLSDPPASATQDRLTIRWTTAGLALALVVVVVVGLCCRPRVAARVPSLVVAATAAGFFTLASAGLHGTRWGFNGLWSDAGFRTEAANRLATASPWPPWPDYAYAGLPAYYPPALPWVQARVAELLGLPGWAGVRPTTLLLAAAVPLLAFWSWRRVLPDLTASLVVVATTVLTPDLVKPDEWLVLSLVVPWWLELVRGHLRAELAPRRWWVHGLVLGVLLLWHTYFFLPLGIASVVAVVLDRARRRRPPLGWWTAAGVGFVGLVVAAPYWLPVAWLRVHGAPSDNLQLRWSDDGWSWPPWPVPVDLVGVVGLLGVVWLVARARRCPLATSLAIATGVAYVFFLVGESLQAEGVAFLAEKSQHLIRALLAVTGVLCLVDLGTLADVAGAWGRGRSSRWRPVATGLVAVALVVPGAVGAADHWATGPQAQGALQTRYPDGGYPSGGAPRADARRHPWAVVPSDPPVSRVVSAWRDLTGHVPDGRDVVITDRGDLLGTTAAHPFVEPKSVYSHPNGQFRARLRLLRSLAACSDPSCAVGVIGDARRQLGRLDGLVLRTDRGDPVLHVAVDRFPDAWDSHDLRFDRALFRGPAFRLREVGTVAVVLFRS